MAQRGGRFVRFGCYVLFLMLLWGHDTALSKPVEKIYLLMDSAELKTVIAENERVLQENSTDINSLKILGIAYHNLAVLGEKEASEKACSYLSKAAGLAAQDCEILVYLGSAYTLLGRDAVNPLAKINQVQKGCKLMDDAVAKEPENIVVRLTRATNSLRLPAFFHRAEKAEEDLLHLLRIHQAAPGKFSPELLARIYYLLGEYYQSKGEKYLPEAKKYWGKAWETAPDSADGKAAKSRMEAY